MRLRHTLQQRQLRARPATWREAREPGSRKKRGSLWSTIRRFTRMTQTVDIVRLVESTSDALRRRRHRRGIARRKRIRAGRIQLVESWVVSREVQGRGRLDGRARYVLRLIGRIRLLRPAIARLLTHDILQFVILEARTPMVSRADPAFIEIHSATSCAARVPATHRSRRLMVADRFSLTGRP